jgi:hypothetical protein
MTPERIKEIDERINAARTLVSESTWNDDAAYVLSILGYPWTLLALRELLEFALEQLPAEPEP